MIKYSIEQFIEKSNIIHNNYFDYSLSIYINNRTKVKIICPIHGIFEQEPKTHLSGHGCKKCQINNQFNTTDNFIEKSNIVHNNYFDYSLLEYVDNKTNVKIICPIHGEFLQSPKNHKYSGCPKCNESKGEKMINKILDDKYIKYIKQKKFDKCENIKKLSFDFYLPDYNVCIEYDGEQHYKPITYFGGIKRYEIQKKRDEIKNIYCIENNIKLLRISYKENIKEKIEKYINI